MSLETIRVHAVTFNYADQRDVPEDLKEFCGVRDRQDIPDLIVIGLQEIVDERDWKEALKATLSPLDFVMIKSRRMASIMALAYLRRPLLKSLSRIESEIKPTGFADLVGNKGGVSLRFRLYDVSMCFVVAHFTAFDEQVVARVNDFNEIVASHHFRDSDTPNLLDHDYIFWLGDLNFRVDNLSREEVEQAVAQSNYDALLRNDQLCTLVAKGDIFESFSEGAINFAPTYKFDLNTDTFDTSSKRRKPAYCDRVLYFAHTLSVHNASSLELTLNHYDSISSYKQSDHRPVFARFDARVPSRFANAMQCTFALCNQSSSRNSPARSKREATPPQAAIQKDGVRFVNTKCELEFTFEFGCGHEDASQLSNNTSWLADVASSSLRSLVSLGMGLAGGKASVTEKSASSESTDAASTDVPDCSNSSCQSTVHQGNLFGYRGDWIAVYPTNFSDFEQYATFIYASSATPLSSSGVASRYSAKLSSSMLQQLELGKRYLLAYFSAKQRSVIGFSEPFELY